MLNKSEIAFADQTRQEIGRAQTNNSTSKQLWSFSKRKRFHRIKTECPHAFYTNNQTQTTLSNPKFSFVKSMRKLFTKITQTPLPGTYHIETNIKNKGKTFGLSRQKCLTNSYINKQLQKVPAPSKYNNDNDSSKRRGFSMRPKTAQERNYFIENKEHLSTPGPALYQSKIQKQIGRATLTKFKSTILGYTGMMKKSPRFAPNANKNPGPSQYDPFGKPANTKSNGGAINQTIRDSFIDDIKSNKYGPGPGDYQLPSQFGHYKRVNSSKVKRFITS